MLFASSSGAYDELGASWRWPHFSVSELACRCDGRFCQSSYWHDPDFLDALEALRASSGRPLIITSGHRCAQWNAAIGGAPLSHHKKIAVDISLLGHDRFSLRDAALRNGFLGQGLARTFIHLDRRARPATWFYGRSKEVWQISQD
ncbi:MAG: D-Ala-D-Ala carboxypeptidase family metallohydrolase [Pseudomonadota bacterium]